MEKINSDTGQENTPEKYDFEKSFSKREIIDFFGTDLEIIDIKPEHLKTDIPILIAPGWGETIDTFKDSIRVLVEGGRRVLSLDHPRHGNEMKDVDPDLREVYGPEDELRKALALIEILNERISGKADVIAHSEGGINTAIAAMLQAEKFHTVVFANAGGFMGKDSFLGLTGRFSMSTIREAIDSVFTYDPERRSRIQQTLSGLTKYIASNPVRATKESMAISATQVEGVLGYLHEVGVGVVVVCGEGDSVFPIERVNKMLEEKHVDALVPMQGTHNEIFYDPVRYMGAIEAKIEELNSRKVSESNPKL